MPSLHRQDEMFGDIAVRENLVTREKIERALVIQRCISGRTKVYMPLGSVLHKMGLLTEDQVDRVLALKNGVPPEEAAVREETASDDGPQYCDPNTCLNIAVSDDKLTVTIAPAGDNFVAPPIHDVKRLLSEREIVFGLISDQLLSTHLEKSPMPMDPFVVARGEPPVPGRPAEVRYYFDTDPMRIGTLLEDGTMDWKNRGDIPQVNEGDLLAEKEGGDPGGPGINVYGLEVPPPRIKEPALKFTKGAGRSEDGQQIVAKCDGMPKLGADGRIGVFKVLPIDGDIGVETGNIEFDGHIEVNGGVTSGYKVAGASLNVKEIQNARIELSEDLSSDAGIYGSQVIVGGNLKASHIHNSTVEVLGDLVVQKEIFGCTIAINGRCLVESGKIIASTITSKKGVQVKDIGTQASKPSELTVGVDFKFQRDMESAEQQIEQLAESRAVAEAEVAQLRGRIDDLDAELGAVAQDQDGCMVQKRQLEAKLKTPAIAASAEKQSLIEELIGDLGKKYDQLDEHVKRIMSQDDLVRAKMAALQKQIKEMEAQSDAATEQMAVLEEAARLDPGIPVVKASGMVYSKTTVVGPHKKIIIPNEMQNVRIAESEEDPKQYAMKISSLR